MKHVIQDWRNFSNPVFCLMTSTRRTFRKIGITILLSAGAVFLYYRQSLSVIPYGGFSRNFIPSPLLSSKAYDLDYNSFYIAGVSDSHLYLGNYTAPLHVLVFNLAMEEKKDWLLSLPGIKTWRGPIEIKVDSPYFHIFNGVEPFVYRGILSSNNVMTLAKNDSVFFKTAEPLEGGSYIFKAESAVNHEDVILKRDFGNKIISIHNNILEKQIDGLFCTDGMLHYSKGFGSIVYVYYYRNEFILADTNFVEITRVHTIDTISKARLKVGSFNHGKTKTLAAPPFIVNRRSSVYGNKLFVQSNVRANNEKPLVFKNNPVIDVYDLRRRNYIFSFYVPQYQGIQMNSFRVRKSTIVAIYDRYLLVYTLHPQAFSNQLEDATITNSRPLRPAVVGDSLFHI